MKRIVKPDGVNQVAQEAEGGEWLEDYPNLIEFLTCTTYSDPPGRRKPGSLSIWTRFKMWCCSLRDNDNGACLRIEALTPDQLLHALETLLATGNAPWEFPPEPEPPAKGKKR